VIVLVIAVYNYHSSTYGNHSYHLLLSRFVIYFHGNAYDIGGLKEADLEAYGSTFGAHVLLFEYPGYGLFPGKATAFNVDNAAIFAYHFVLTTIGWPSEHILLHGHSIGCGPLLEVVRIYSGLNKHTLSNSSSSSNSNTDAYDLAIFPSPILLHSSFVSIRDVAKRASPLGGNFITDRWVNLEVLKTFKGRVLFVHGEKDALTPVNAIKQLYDACPSKHKQHYFTNADHNSVSLGRVSQVVKSFLASVPLELETIPELDCAGLRETFAPPQPGDDDRME